MGLLAAGLAHDLNNMLGGIVATAELLKLRFDEDGESARDAAMIVDQATRASGLIRQILAFARQDLLVPQADSLEQLVGRLAPMVEVLSGHRIEMRHGPPVQISIDPTAFERAVVNLVLNAKAAGNGRIRISTERVPASILPAAGRTFMPSIPYGAIHVEDDGPGVDPAHAARIFEPYFTTRAGGQGLGLSTAYGLVKQSGGFLLHDRSELGGARFSIYLPEAASRTNAPRLRFDCAAQVVLLVEDDLLLRMGTARGLERMGYRVRQAADAEGALKRLEAERPSLLLCDIRLPGRDGVSLAREARAMHPELPVLLVSGFADEAARSAIPELGAGFLLKPFTQKALAESIGALVR